MKDFLKFTTMTSFVVLSSFAFHHQAVAEPANANKGVYTSPITDKSNAEAFSINIPQYQESNEMSALAINQNINKWQTFITFGAANEDHSYYRIDVMPSNPMMSLSQINKQLVQELLKEASVFGGDIQPLSSTKLKVNGHDAYYQTFTQESSGVTFANNSDTPAHLTALTKSQTYTHAVLVMQDGKYNVVFWFQGSNLGGAANPYAITDSNRSKVENYEWEPFKQFVESFKVGNEVAYNDTRPKSVFGICMKNCTKKNGNLDGS